MDLPIYLPTKKVFVQTFFFGKSMADPWMIFQCFISWNLRLGWRIPYLPTIWTYVQNFVFFLLDPLLIDFFYIYIFGGPPKQSLKKKLKY